MTSACVDIPTSLDAAEYELVDTDVGGVWISRRDHVMRPFMAKSGTWEPEEGRLLRQLLVPGSRFLDVGANVGYFSLLAGKAAPGVTIDAVEPDPVNIGALRLNLWANRVGARVWPVALDDRDGALMLTEMPNNLGDVRMGRAKGGTSNGRATAVVPAAMGDRLFGGRVFDVVKIDVQGWELEVIMGLEKTIRSNPGTRLVVEFWPEPLRERGKDPAAVLAAYRELGYVIRAVMDGVAARLSDARIMDRCASGGPQGQVNLVLMRP